jgi:hypothetical protein
MKRILVSLLTAVGITAPFVSSLAAQSNPQQADIPFAFLVSKRTMPAGRYRVTRLSPSAPVFALQDGRGSSVIVMLPRNEQGKPEAPSLTFACYGSEHVLAKVTPPDSDTAYALSNSSIEKNLSHKLGIASMVAIKISTR